MWEAVFRAFKREMDSTCRTMQSTPSLQQLKKTSQQLKTKRPPHVLMPVASAELNIKRAAQVMLHSEASTSLQIDAAEARKVHAWLGRTMRFTGIFLCPGALIQSSDATGDGRQNWPWVCLARRQWLLRATVANLMYEPRRFGSIAAMKSGSASGRPETCLCVIDDEDGRVVPTRS